MSGQSRFRPRMLLASLAGVLASLARAYDGKTMARVAMSLAGVLTSLAGVLAWLAGVIPWILYYFLIPILVLLNPVYMVCVISQESGVSSIIAGFKPEEHKNIQTWLSEDALGRTSIVVLALIFGYFATRLISPLCETYKILLKPWLKVNDQGKSYSKELADKLPSPNRQLKRLTNHGNSVPAGWSPHIGRSADTQSSPSEPKWTPSRIMMKVTQQDKERQWPLWELFGNMLKHSLIWFVAFALFFSVWVYQKLVVGREPVNLSMQIENSLKKVLISEEVLNMITTNVVSLEPIVTLPVLFGRAQFDNQSNGDSKRFSKDSSGIKLDRNSEMQLRRYLDLLNELSTIRSDLQLLVVGYASDTPIPIPGQGPYDANVIVANLRAAVVANFLKKEQASRKDEADLMDLSICRTVWKGYNGLRDCRPYQTSNGQPRDPAHVPLLERMNQSVMLYIMDEQRANSTCIGGQDSENLCSKL